MRLKHGFRWALGPLALLSFLSASCGTVSAEGDATPPNLDDYSFTPTSIDISGGAQNVTFTIHATDDLTGVQNVCTNFRSPSGQQFRGGCTYTPFSGDRLDGVWEGTVSFPQYAEGGTWQVDNAYACDLFQCKFLYMSDLIAMGINTNLDVLSFPADATLPDFDSYTFTPALIDTSGGAESVTFTMHATDDLTGVQNVCTNFRSPSGQQYRGACSYTPTSGDRLGGDWDGTVFFAQYSEEGIWHVDNAYACDLFQCKFLYTSDFIALGIDVELQIGRPSIGIDDVAVAEGNVRTTNVSLTVSLSFPSAETITVSYATNAGTARSGSDYVSTSGTLTFPPGTTSRTATVRVRGDRQFEANETFFVNLTSPSNASILDGEGVGTILNDDSGRP